MFYIFNTYPVIIISIIILSVAMAIILASLSYILIIRPLKNQLNTQANIMYTLIRKTCIYNDELSLIIKDNEKIKKDIASLSTSLDSYIIDMKKQLEEKIYPDPHLAMLITNTIQDQIETEIALTQKLTLKPRDMLDTVIENTQKTYPMVDTNYISKKAIAMIENMNKK